MSRPGAGVQSPAASGRGNFNNQIKNVQAQSNSNNYSTPSLPSIIKYIKNSLSQPVKVSLDDGKQHFGYLWAFDAEMAIVVLEIPKNLSIVNAKIEDYPSTAAAYPSSTLSSLKVAAQGGDASGSKTTFQLIKLQRISRVDRLQGPQLAAFEKMKMTEITTDVNVAAAEAREKAATNEALKRASRIGHGVSTLAQDVFDALSKTLPCRWADQHIIVMDEIVISPDKYDAATVPQYQQSTLQALADGKEVAGVPEDAKAKATRWQRVSKVLEGERKRIQAKTIAAA